MTLVGDEPAQVLAAEQPRIVPALGRIVLQEDAQFRCGPAGCVEDAAGARRLRRLQQPGQVIPDQIRSQRCGMPVSSKWLPRCGNRIPKWSVSINPASRVSAGV